MKFLLKKNQVLKPFNDLVSDRNDKKSFIQSYRPLLWRSLDFSHLR